MPCYKPIQAEQKDNGDVVFHKIGAKRIEIPCGKCTGCKLEKARQWAGRCANEASLHEHNSFATLTYSDENLPKGGTLVKKHLQNFHKRLRYYHEHRYYSAGEYGEETWRPHYHSILFGYIPKDIKFHTTTKLGHKVYVSEELDRIWGYGQCLIGAVTFESAGYVARYTMKKITGDLAETHYARITETGELYKLLPEFSIMSLKPGIGQKWYETYHQDVNQMDHWIVNGAKSKPPKYYDKLLKRRDSTEYNFTKSDRENAAALRTSDNTEERLATKLAVKEAQIKSLRKS